MNEIETVEVMGHRLVAQQISTRKVCAVCGKQYRHEQMIRQACAGPPEPTTREILTDQQRRYLEVGHAACGHRVKTYREIAQALGVHLERARQIHMEIMRRVRWYRSASRRHATECSPVETVQGQWLICLRAHGIVTPENDALAESLIRGICRDEALSRRTPIRRNSWRLRRQF